VDDLPWLDRVVFTLHHTYAAENRVVTVVQAPFQMYEQAYGGFQLLVKLFLKGSSLTVEVPSACCVAKNNSVKDPLF